MKSFLVLLGLLLIQSCSTAVVRILPGEDGLHTVISRDIEQDGAEKEAVEAAKKYCEEKQMEAVFVKEESKYTGQMDEGTRNMIRKGSKAAIILGGVGATSSRRATPGAILGSAGTVGHVMTSDRDYKSEVKFKCKGNLK